MEHTKGLVRVRARLQLKLPVTVSCQESAEYQWIEKARLVDVNQFGAGFTLTRPVEVGRLIHLSIPLPHQLRCYDQFEPQYPIWGLVRYISILKSDPPWFRIGVAFVGKHPPASYQEDPTSKYDPLPIMTGAGSLWRLNRRPLEESERREARLTLPLEVVVEAFDGNGGSALREHTVTEVITSLGACIPSTLEVSVGRVLRLSSVTDGISIFAAVRSRERGADGITRLGLEFIADRWPLERGAGFTYQKTS